MSQAEPQSPGPPSGAPGRPGQFSLGDAIALGISSSGPAQTLAVSLASLVAASRYGGVVPVLVCFLPMLGIALGYQRLNRWNPRAGATYTWVAQVFHPLLGFLSGWMILLYYTFGTTSLTIPAGTYTLELLAPRLVDHPLAVFLSGGAWNVLVTVLALKGLKLAARAEWAIALLQYGTLLLLAALGIAALAQGTAAVAFSPHWFTLDGLGGMPGLMGGILIACFMYSGWDAAIYINEESTDRAHQPGVAAIASVIALALLYVLAVLGLQAVLPAQELQAHAGDALARTYTRLLPAGPPGLMSLVVLAGTLATLQAAVISAARMGFAMSRDGVMPALFRRIDPRTGNPWAATLVMSGINLALLALCLSTGGVARALGNVVGSLGLISILFYGLTAAAAVWQQRRTLTRSGRDLLWGGLLPGLGALFMAWVAVEAVRVGATGPAVLGWGGGSLAVGLIVALVLSRRGNIAFFAPAAPARDAQLHEGATS